jgi:hypothetical protein
MLAYYVGYLPFAVRLLIVCLVFALGSVGLHRVAPKLDIEGRVLVFLLVSVALLATWTCLAWA